MLTVLAPAARKSLGIIRPVNDAQNPLLIFLAGQARVRLLAEPPKKAGPPHPYLSSPQRQLLWTLQYPPCR